VGPVVLVEGVLHRDDGVLGAQIDVQVGQGVAGQNLGAVVLGGLEVEVVLAYIYDKI
jgi:hypothetical protein